MTSLHKIIADVLTVSPSRVTGDMEMKNTAEWDSLKHMELIIAIEKAFAIELTGDEIAEMTSVAAITSILKKRGVCT